MHNLFLEKLEKFNINYAENVSMKDHTTFKIGGNADFFISVNNTRSL